ncbi:hypothetical protein FXV77_05520 [Sphingobacterium phlebotomi]|uniref:Uncharacterized protein n=1 Tax=Sphingobacterium phlebotomi TaxID=2605433 RepID=A0A5D4HA31_9SPHI|nr:hypothetical protein [Sphingobacterium phlebotomi]TYR37464.1 hypothetical protein FXV77_05520 [Sphingobacterium phlebotomi]
MEIEIKRIAYNPRLDENSFAANLFINGEKAATVNCKNRMTKYYALDGKGLELVKQAEDFIKKLPGEKKVIDGKEQTVKPTLIDHIDGLFNKYLNDIKLKKFDKKVDQIQKKNIVIGEYGRYTRTHPVKELTGLLLQDQGREILKQTITNHVIPTMSENEQILNNNISETILKAAGLKQPQYRKGETDQKEKVSNQKKTGMKP